MQKAIFLFLLLFVAVESAFSAAWTGANNEPNDMKNIDGKAFYVITNANELAWFANQVNGGRTTINAVLANDIVFGSSTTVTSTVNWTSIGKDSTHMFAGIFDGAGYTIYGLYIDDGRKYAGMFGFIKSGGVVKNTKLQKNKIKGQLYSGGIAALNAGLISGCSNAGSTENLFQEAYSSNVISYTGGIVAYNVGTVDNCNNSGSIVPDLCCSYFGTPQRYAGGIVGINTGFVSNCKNTGNVTPDAAAYYSGGIVGYNKGSVVSCFNSGNITSKYGGNFFGGIVGYNAGTLDQCGNTGNLLSSGAEPSLGGVVGYNIKSVSNSYNSGRVVALYHGSYSARSGGVVGTDSSSGAVVKNCISMGDTIKGYFIGGVAGVNIKSARIVNSYYNSSILLPFFTNSIKKDVGAVGQDSASITNVAGKSTADMQKDQFAWILNTANGTATNSKIWSRTTGYPIFATSTNKPIFRVVFNDNGATSNRYGTNKGTVSFPSNPTPATGYIFDGWYNGTTKVSASTVFTADATVSAKYLNTATLSYTIKFYNDDKKTLLSTQSVGYGKTPVYSDSTPTKEADAQYTYSFKGWTPTLAAAYGDGVYYAVYDSTLNVYTITFVNYDGSILRSSDYEYGTSPTYQGVPARESTEEWFYICAGFTPTWAPVTKAATYTAVYDSIKVKYAITFADHDGTILRVYNVDYGAIPSYGGIPTRTGSAEWAYSFKEWTPSLEAVTKAATYTAVYDSSVARHNIVFVDYDGTKIQDEDVLYGSLPVEPAAPSRKATTGYTYTFSGWNKNIVEVDGPAVYVAVYDSTKNSYEVTFVDYDGAEIQKMTLEYGEMPVCSKVPTRESSEEWNYEFKGWEPAITSVAGKMTYKAVYALSKVDYTVVLKNEGSVVDVANIAYGNVYTIPGGPSKEGFSFAGWYEDETLLGYVGDAFVVTRNVVAEAKFFINSYEVRFLNFDRTLLKSEKYEYGSVPAYGGLVSREANAEWSYEFSGWTPAITKVSKNISYIATFDSTRNKYSVVFMNGNDEVSVQEVEYGASAVAPPAPSKSGYIFAGWNKDFSHVVENIIVEAKYSNVDSLLGGDGTEIVSFAEKAQFNIIVAGRSVQIAGAPAGSAYVVFDMQGRVLATGRTTSANFAVEMPRAGSYMVRVGTQMQRVNVK